MGIYAHCGTAVGMYTLVEGTASVNVYAHRGAAGPHIYARFRAIGENVYFRRGTTAGSVYVRLAGSSRGTLTVLS